MSLLKSVVAFVSISFLLVGCGSGKIDPKPVIEKQLQIMEEFSVAVDGAKTAEEAVVAINTFAEGAEKMTPEILELAKDYPGLEKAMTGGQFPEGLTEFQERFTEMGKKMMGAMFDISKFEEDPRVKEAQKRLIAVFEAQAPADATAPAAAE